MDAPWSPSSGRVALTGLSRPKTNLTIQTDIGLFPRVEPVLQFKNKEKMPDLRVIKWREGGKEGWWGERLGGKMLKNVCEDLQRAS